MLTLVLLAVVLRLGTFFPSVINHDESTYIVIAGEMLRGETYWVDVIDTKPIGIFLIYALFITLSGGSIFVMRLFTAAIVGLTAGLLFRLGQRATDSREVGWAAGLGYVLMTSIYTFYGLSPNTELFFNALTVGAVLLVWCPSAHLATYWMAGLLLGIAFVIKPVTAADALAVGLLLLWQGRREGRLLTAIVKRCIPLTLAFLVPITLAFGYYVELDRGREFLFYTFQTPGRYAAERVWWEPPRYMADFLGRFFPYTLLAIFALVEKRSADRPWQFFCLLWFACVTVMILLPGRSFGHYQIQLMPALASLAATWWHPARQGQAWLRGWPPRTRRRLLASVFGVLSLGLVAYYAVGKFDQPRALAREIAPLLPPGATLYTGNSHQILYHLLDRPAPTPYVHPSLLFYPPNADALAIDLPAAARHIVNEEQPEIAILRLRDQFEDHPVETAIRRAYTPIDTLFGDLILYQREEE